MNTDKYLETKKKLAKLMGYAVLLVSFKLSADGFGFQTEDSLLIGWILAFAVTTSQLIFNTSIKKLNWTIVLVGLISYAYSIWTNIMGFYVYRGHSQIVWDLSMNTLISVAGGAFVDIFPEMALAWGYNASQEGDLVGNVAKVFGVDREPTTIEREVADTQRFPPKETGLPSFLQKARHNENQRPRR